MVNTALRDSQVGPDAARLGTWKTCSSRKLRPEGIFYFPRKFETSAASAPPTLHPCSVSPRSSIATKSATRFARVSGRLASSTR
jgi:hypothetical protein